MELNVGGKVPDIVLPDHDGHTFRLSDHSGSPVVLFFYPKDDTPGCTTEAQDFSALLSDFDAAGAVVVGISPDTAASHARFREKRDLDVRLLADTERTASEAYGVWQEKTAYGRTSMGIVRSTFLIGPDGKLARVWRKVQVKAHAQAVLEAVTDLVSTAA